MNQSALINAPAAGLSAQNVSAEKRLSRRGFLNLRAVGSAVAAVAGTAAVARVGRATPPTISADVDPGSVTRKLVDRITFGARQEDVDLAESLGYAGYLEYQLNLQPADEDAAVAARLNDGTTFPWLNPGNGAVYDQVLSSTGSGPVTASLIDSTIYRATFSKRQLFEKMVEFWSDHFSMDVNVNSLDWLKLFDDRSVIRPNALGTFPALLNASARSAAMLNYLNNDVSRVGAINENYGREVLELHSMGVESGYTQSDVIAMARCLTGWGWYNRNPPTPDDIGTFRYTASNHDNGGKTFSRLFNLTDPSRPLVFGPNGGINDGVRILDILGRHPSTARFIAGKLCRRFIGEDCPQWVVDAVTSTYLNSNPIGDIKSMLRTMLSPAVLADASPRLKRPFHLFASAMRLVLPNEGAMVAFSTLKNNYLFPAGHVPFNWNPPDGYPDRNLYWAGQILPRWNFGARLLTTSGGGTIGGINGLTVDVAAVNRIFPTQNTAQQIVDRIDQFFFSGGMSPAEKNRIRTFLPATGSANIIQKRDALGLAIDSPGFQWY